MEIGLLDVGIDLDRVDATGGVGNVGCRLFVTDLTDIEPSDLEAEQLLLTGQFDCTGTVLAAGAASDKFHEEDPRSALQKQQSDFTSMGELL